MREIVPLGQAERGAGPRLPGRAERSRVRRTRTTSSCSSRLHLRGPGAHHHHQPVLRARRGDAPGDQRRDPARRARRALRLGDRRPGAGLPRAAVVLRGAAARRREDLAATRRRTSCTRSTSRSTTRSPSSARATWTCARSSSTWRSRCSCAAPRSCARCARSRTATGEISRELTLEEWMTAAAAVDGARQPRAADLGAAVVVSARGFSRTVGSSGAGSAIPVVAVDRAEPAVGIVAPDDVGLPLPPERRRSRRGCGR